MLTESEQVSFQTFPCRWRFIIEIFARSDLPVLKQYDVCVQFQNSFFVIDRKVLSPVVICETQEPVDLIVWYCTCRMAIIPQKPQEGAGSLFVGYSVLVKLRCETHRYEYSFVWQTWSMHGSKPAYQA